MLLVMLALGLVAIPILLQRWLTVTVRLAGPRPLDIGLVFSCVVAAYGALPLVGIFLASQGIGELHDSRFGDRIPDASAVVSVGLMYLLFLGGFALCYCALTTGASLSVPPPPADRPSRRDVWIVLALFVAVKASLLASRLALGIEKGEDYLATYIELAGQPLIVQQLMGIVSASELSVAILGIVVVIARDPRLHRWVALFVVLQIAAAIVAGGSRSHAFACALAYVVARSIYDRRMRYWFVVSAGAAGLLTFLLAGLLRQAKIGGEDVSNLYLLQGGEFLTLFYNALDLAERRHDLDTPQFRIGLYLVDILRLLPRQLVGDFKVDPAALYVATFYPEFRDAGGGLAFGAIAESTVGFGAGEALVRGSLVGAVLALVARACLRGRHSAVRAFIYTWFVVLSYQSIRDTTFTTFARFMFQVLPILVVLRLAGALRTHRAAARGRHSGGGVTVQIASMSTRSNPVDRRRPT